MVKDGNEVGFSGKHQPYCYLGRLGYDTNGDRLGLGKIPIMQLRFSAG